MNLQELNKKYADYSRWDLLYEIKRLQKLFDMACEYLWEMYGYCPFHFVASDEECETRECKDCWKQYFVNKLKEG